jgi:hypothetical protein
MKDQIKEILDIVGPSGFVGYFDLVPLGDGRHERKRSESWNEAGITEDDQKMIDHCKQWIRQFVGPRKTVNSKGSSSYGLKHTVEQWAGTYILNGAFIVAAVEEGYEYKRSGPNAYFNMSFKSASQKESPIKRASGRLRACRISPISEEEWRAVGKQICACRNANLDLRRMISGHVPAKTIDKAIKIEREIDLLRSNLEDEMFARGGPRDTRVFYPPHAEEPGGGS